MLYFSKSLMLSYISFILFGIGFSNGVVPTLRNSTRYFPERKGLVNGIVASGFGMSSVLLSFIIKIIINPSNVKIDVDSFYPEDVYMNIKKYLLFAIILFSSTGIVCVLLTFPYKEEEKDKNQIFIENNNKSDIDIDISIDKDIKNKPNENHIDSIPNSKCGYTPTSFQNSSLAVVLKRFVLNKNVLLFIILVFTMYSVPATFFNTFKYFSNRNTEFINESQAFIGIILLNSSNGILRSVWGYFFDVIRFKILISIAISIQIIVSIQFYWSISYIPIVYINLILIGSLNSCINVLFSSIVYRKYGTKYGSEVYSFFYIAYGFATLIAPCLSIFLDLPHSKNKIPYLIIYSSGSLLGVIGYVVLYYLNIETEEE